MFYCLFKREGKNNKMENFVTPSDLSNIATAGYIFIEIIQVMKFRCSISDTLRYNADRLKRVLMKFKQICHKFLENNNPLVNGIPHTTEFWFKINGKNNVRIYNFVMDM